MDKCRQRKILQKVVGYHEEHKAQQQKSCCYFGPESLTFSTPNFRHPSRKASTFIEHFGIVNFGL